MSLHRFMLYHGGCLYKKADSYGLGIRSFMLSLEKVIVEIGAVRRGDGERAVILLVVMTSMVPVS